MSSGAIRSDSLRASKNGRSSSAGNSSCPAATGVWEVKTVVRATISSAAFESSPRVCISRAMRSRALKAECPSFKWQTRGSRPISCSARSPPMPSRISCSRRVRWSPPYNCAVMSRHSDGLSGMCASSRTSGIRPTWAFHTDALSGCPGAGMEIVSGAPPGPGTGSSGRA